MQIIARAQWGAAPPKDTTRVDPTQRVATGWHYDDVVPVKVPDHSGCAAQIRAIQRFHQAPKPGGRGWSDIGYNFLICQHGSIFEGRGWDVLGAHAGAAGNVPSIGVQLRVGGDQQPSDAAKQAAAEFHREAERRFGRKLDRKVHSDYLATSCPGNVVKSWVRAGMPVSGNPQPAQENPVTIPDIGGRIGQRWAELGGPRSALGNPVGDEVKTDTGAWRAFERGFMLWSLDTDARENRGAIRERYADYGFEGGLLGYPTSDELDAARGGRFQTYQRGVIYWHPDTGSHAVYGRVRDRWAELGWENGPLGFPTGDEFDGAKPGRVQNFQGGVMYFTQAGDAQPVWGSMREQYARDGYENGKWGYPLGPEVNTGTGWVQRFQGGEMRIGAPVATAKLTTYTRPVRHGYTTFRGKPCCTCLAEWLPRYEQALLRAGIIKQSIDIYQLRGGAPASGGTHTQGGAFDIVQRSPEAIRIARQMGAAAWARNTMSPPHQHGVLKGCDTNDPAYYQIQALNAGYNGLGTGGRGGRDDGPRQGITWPIINWDDGIRRMA